MGNIEVYEVPKRHIEEWHVNKYSSDPGLTKQPAQTHRKSVAEGDPAAGRTASKTSNPVSCPGRSVEQNQEANVVPATQI